jgi:hypothetical protein
MLRMMIGILIIIALFSLMACGQGRSQVYRTTYDGTLSVTNGLDHIGYQNGWATINGEKVEIPAGTKEILIVDVGASFVIQADEHQLAKVVKKEIQ